jgi:serine/threonine protein kinase
MPSSRDSRWSIPGEWPRSAQQQVFCDPFRFLRGLGKGAFGRVEEVIRLCDSKNFARKTMEMPENVIWMDFRNAVLKEVDIMQKLKSIPVVTLDSYMEYQDQSMQIYMTPVADKNLERALRDCSRRGGTNSQLVYRWFGCLLKTLAYVHRECVLHKDIKPQNILVKDGVIYLADFGLSREFKGGLSQTFSVIAGTEEYQAPEFDNEGGHGRAADVFSLGCVFAEMLTVARNKSLDDFRAKRIFPIPPHIRKYYGEPKPSFHKCIDEVREWITGLRGDEKDNLLIDTMLHMLEYDSNKRITAADALTRLNGQRDLFCKHCI